MIITPQIKDKVLAELLSGDSPVFDFDYTDSETTFGFNPMYMKIILDDFQDCGLIKSTYYGSAGARIHIKAKAMDLFNHGGFTAEEEILKANINKLGFELEVLSKQLEPKYLEIATNLSQIGSAIMQGLTLFK